MKHKFRMLNGFEDCANYECITCKGQFINLYDEAYKYCPRCGVEFYGKEKINPRYPEKYTNTYDWLKQFEAKDRFVLETRSLANQKLSNDSFAAVNCMSYYTHWHLVMHCRVGAIGLDSKWGKVSAAIYFVRYYKELVDRYKNTDTQVRLLLFHPDKTYKILMKNYET